VVPVAGSPAVACLPLPADPALAGQGFTVQGLALQSSGCMVATDVLIVVVQP